mgnify:FL=1
MRSIWKFPLESAAPTRQTVEIPSDRGDEGILSVGLDPHGELCVWVEVNPKAEEKEKHIFTVLGTGHPFPQDENLGRFIGTVSMVPAGMPFIFHIFHYKERD